jgi:hypothetical protein
MNIEAEVLALEAKLDPLDRIVRLLTASLDAPRMHNSINGQGFRYGEPGVIHLCLVKGVRAISAFNASLELARKGYMQEIAVIRRAILTPRIASSENVTKQVAAVRLLIDQH